MFVLEVEFPSMLPRLPPKIHALLARQPLPLPLALPLALPVAADPAEAAGPFTKLQSDRSLRGGSSTAREALREAPPRRTWRMRPSASNEAARLPDRPEEGISPSGLTMEVTGTRLWWRQ